jgi:hypothetical protein
MKPPVLARLLLLALLFAAFPAFPAFSTTTLSFDGGGYWLSMEIGHDQRPGIASVSFPSPGDTKGVVLRGNYKVEVFDTQREVLVLRYEGGDVRVKPFTLTVRGTKATLRTERRTIESEFSWFM